MRTSLHDLNRSRGRALYRNRPERACASELAAPFHACSGARCTGFIHYLSSAAATPGSSLPSRNSKDAPPPVEMWLILSPKPSWLTAAAESPPPMIVVASVSASDFRYRDGTLCSESRVLEYAHRSVPYNGLCGLHSFCVELCRSPVRYPRPSLSAGIASGRKRTHTSTGASIGFGNSCDNGCIYRKKQLLAKLLCLLHHLLAVVDLCIVN